MSSGSFFKVLLKNFDVLAGPLVTLVYPLYASIQAIETRSTVDDQQWLTYWVLYSLITLFELTFAKVIEWLPFWPYAKLLFNCWLVLPYFSGAAYVYQHYVRPLYMNQQTINIWYVPRKKDVFSKPDDFLFAAERFIEENGTDAFQKLLQKADKVPKGPKLTEQASKPAEKAPKPRKTNRRVTFEDVEIDKISNSHKNDSHTIFGSSSHTIFGSSNNHGVFDSSNIHPIYDDEPEREPDTWRNSNFMIFDDEHYSRRH